MSWTDRDSRIAIMTLRDKYKIKTFIETGTFKGVNAHIMSNIFDNVITIEKDYNYFKIAMLNNIGKKNICFLWDSSPEILKTLKKGLKAIIYLDAHFYDKKAKQKFVVIDELKALKSHKNKTLIIHDFDNNLGHINYDGQSLDFGLLKRHLKKVNPNFHYYTNSLASCSIIKQSSVNEFPPQFREVVKDNLDYAWSRPEKTFRGILYCTPTRLSKIDQQLMGVRPWPPQY